MKCSWQLLLCFSISRSVPEIFAIEVESCWKSRWILDIFAIPNFVGVPLAKLVSTLSPAPPPASPGKVSWGYAHYPISTPTAQTFIDRSSWNSNLRNTSGRPPHMPNFLKIGLRGWVSGQTPSLSQFWFYPLFFCLCILCTASWTYHWTDYDARWLIGRVFRQYCAFWGSRWWKIIIRGQNPQKRKFRRPE